MGAGCNAPCDGIGRIDIEAGGALHVGCRRVRVLQDIPRHTIGERRLPDTLWPTDQPGVWNAAASIGIQQCRLGLLVAKQIGGLPWMRNRELAFGPVAHARFATLSAGFVKKRSRKAAQMLAATFSGFGVASIRTHRSGSPDAICRYASRNC